MVLNHVAKRTGLFVIRSACAHADVFGSRDLDAVDVLAVPQRLEDPVCKAKDQEVLHGFFSEVMVDAIYMFFLELLGHNSVQCDRRIQVLAERLFYDDTGPPRATLRATDL